MYIYIDIPIIYIYNIYNYNIIIYLSIIILIYIIIHNCHYINIIIIEYLYHIDIRIVIKIMGSYYISNSINNRNSN